ncbi:MAG: OmpP1/FadL family transporter [Gallionella sp.]|jgi:long-chain fatty acid transport protein
MMFSKTAVGWSVASALLVMAGGATASGFALIEQSGSGLGNAFAGSAASAEDASTIFYNPAGMSRLSGRQIVVLGNAITPSAKFSNTASTIPAPGFVAAPVGRDAGGTTIVPGAYFSWELDPKWSAGIGLGAPFGLKTEYDPNWMGRFHAIRSEIKTINLNPSMAYKLNDGLSFGFGVNWQRIDAGLTKAVNYAAFGAPAGTEGTNNLAGSDSAWGYNLGAMFNVNPNTTVGLAYRSAMNYKISGTATYYGRTAALTAATLVSAAAAAQIGDSAFTANLNLPATVSLALKYQANAQWDVLLDATQTQWSSIQSLDLYRSSGIATGLSLESVQFKWRDTWRVAVGANHHYNEHWTARAGVAYDQTPTSDAYRIARLPDSDRTWLSLGGQYKPGKGDAIDFGYAHLFMNNAALNMNVPVLTAAQAAGRGALTGNYSNQVDIFTVQYAHSF